MNCPHNALKSSGTSPNFLITMVVEVVVLWPLSNEPFIARTETAHLNLHQAQRVLISATSGFGLGPVKPRCANAARLF